MLTILVLIVFLVEFVPPAYKDVAKFFLDYFEPINDDLPPCRVWCMPGLEFGRKLVGRE